MYACMRVCRFRGRVSREPLGQESAYQGATVCIYVCMYVCMHVCVYVVFEDAYLENSLAYVCVCVFVTLCMCMPVQGDTPEGVA
jgi:hypothetical protein